MELPADTPVPNRDPRDGSYALAPGPALPPLGLDDVEVTVETSIGPDTPAEEIVDNKTVRVDGEDLSPETPGTQIICQGCKRVGHIAEQCRLTSCQQWKLEKWTQQGNDRMSTSSDESAQGVPKLPEKATPAPILRPLVPGNRAPTPATVRSNDQTTAKPPQPAVATSTNKSTTSVDRLSSSARTRARAEVTPQPVVGTNPTEDRKEATRTDLFDPPRRHQTNRNGKTGGKNISQTSGSSKTSRKDSRKDT